MRVGFIAPRPAGLLLGYLGDLAFGDPRRGHPVAGFGTMAMNLERRLYADRRSAGILHVGVLVGGMVGAGVGADLLLRNRPVLRTALIAAGTWAVLGGTSLLTEARTVAVHLDRGELAAARIQITHLVGRNPDTLDADGIARACVESVAENTSDAVVGPLFWGAIAGLPGLLGYRAINTLDAMIGHRSERYRRFGWAAARLDDLVNVLPARLTVLMAAVLAPTLGGHPGQTLRIVARDARQHPSPNAGPVEAAFAGVLELTLGGVNTYGEKAEDRGTLGAGAAPSQGDILRAAELS
ncbi:MAG: cobalamin biosynthesis protein, partial [Nakamurella sp.]